LERLAKDKRSGLFCLFISVKEKKFYNKKYRAGWQQSQGEQKTIFKEHRSGNKKPVTSGLYYKNILTIISDDCK
jgi:hypothetical protein